MEQIIIDYMKYFRAKGVECERIGNTLYPDNGACVNFSDLGDGDIYYSIGESKMLWMKWGD
jgi:hypothetical protein